MPHLSATDQPGGNNLFENDAAAILVFAFNALRPA
jgi:hypothetical protein